MRTVLHLDSDRLILALHQKPGVVLAVCDMMDLRIDERRPRKRRT